MGILRFIGKLTGIEDKVAWSHQKSIMALGDDPFGYHYIHVDSDFNVAVFLLKGDHTIHVTIGDPIKASRWLLFNSDGSLEFDKPVSETFHQWKINPKKIQHRGECFDQKGSRIYHAKVLNVEEFLDEINADWVSEKASDYLKKMSENQG